MESWGVEVLTTAVVSLTGKVSVQTAISGQGSRGSVEGEAAARAAASVITRARRSIEATQTSQTLTFCGKPRTNVPGRAPVGSPFSNVASPDTTVAR